MPSKAPVAFDAGPDHGTQYTSVARVVRIFSLAAKDTIEDRIGFTMWALKKAHKADFK